MTAGGLRKQLQAAGLNPVRIYYWNGLLLPLAVLHRKVLARRLDGPSDVKPVAKALDDALFVVTEVERRLPFNVPMGTSVMAVAQAADH